MRGLIWFIVAAALFFAPGLFGPFSRDGNAWFALAVLAWGLIGGCLFLAWVFRVGRQRILRETLRKRAKG